MPISRTPWTVTVSGCGVEVIILEISSAAIPLKVVKQARLVIFIFIFSPELMWSGPALFTCLNIGDCCITCFSLDDTDFSFHDMMHNCLHRERELQSDDPPIFETICSAR
jgi:hypothetical protein